MSARPPRPFLFWFSLRANFFAPETPTIRRHALSVHTASVVVTHKTAAAQDARGEFPYLATALRDQRYVSSGPKRPVYTSPASHITIRFPFPDHHA